MEGQSCRSSPPTAICAALLGAAALTASGLASPEPGHASSGTTFETFWPVSLAELDAMRGGFLLPNGMIVHVSLGFSTAVSQSNGNGVPFAQNSQTLDDSDLTGGTGVVRTVVVTPANQGGSTSSTGQQTVTATPAIPTVTISTDITATVNGLMNVIQNNANSVVIQNSTTLGVDLLNAGIATQAYQFGSFGMRLRSLGALGL